jgi:hypothetical protein
VKKLDQARDQKPQDLQRRDFVKKSTLVGMGVATAAALPQSAIADMSEPQSEKAEQKGYQVTQHVLEYYKTAAL